MSSKNILPPIVFSTCKKYEDVAFYTLKKLLDLVLAQNYRIEIVLVSDSRDLFDRISKYNYDSINIIRYDSKVWSKVLLNGINNLIIKDYENCLLMLDDYYFRSIKFNSLIDLYKTFIKNNFDYLCLKRHSKNLFFSDNLKTIKSYAKIKNCFPINPDHPYPCSLQVAFWKLSYLSDKLKNCENIWDFEKQNTSTLAYISKTHPIDYFMLVDKGYRFLRCFFMKGLSSLKRPYLPIKNQLVDIKNKIRFLIFSFVGLQKNAKKIHVFNYYSEIFELKNFYKRKIFEKNLLKLRYSYNIYHILDFSKFIKFPLLNLKNIISIPLISFENGISLRRFIFIFNEKKIQRILSKDDFVIVFLKEEYIDIKFLNKLPKCNICLVYDGSVISKKLIETLKSYIFNIENKINLITFHQLIDYEF